MGKDKNKTIKRIVFFGLMFAVSGAIAWIASILYGKNTEMLLRNVVMILAGSGIVIFSYSMEEIEHRFIYRNEGKYMRFSLMYLFSLGAAVFLPLLPVTGWPFL